MSVEAGRTSPEKGETLKRRAAKTSKAQERRAVKVAAANLRDGEDKHTALRRARGSVTAPKPREFPRTRTPKIEDFVAKLSREIDRMWLHGQGPHVKRLKKLQALIDQGAEFFQQRPGAAPGENKATFQGYIESVLNFRGSYLQITTSLKHLRDRVQHSIDALEEVQARAAVAVEAEPGNLLPAGVPGSDIDPGDPVPPSSSGE